uniref:Uncharacterized protein n=1 Tax=Magnetococcus massalia (strain MO-1) TaxID=451514 RepID=A0A1S7LJJ3_MAGMO|nr:Conserved protein of unknown function [Candidatus Magnetococcus massalia]
MTILSLTLSIAEGDYAWTGNMELGNPAAFQRISVGDSLTLVLEGESFNLIVDNKSLTRDGVSRPQLSVALISPTARFAFPRAAPLERSWDTPVMAREAAEEAIGESIQWELVDWLIPAGRLSLYGASPLDLIRTLAEAAGGVIDTLPNGKLRVRHRFPAAVPDWEKGSADHILTDSSDNLSCHESHRFQSRVNRVTVRGYLPSGGYLSAEVDKRVDGLSSGRHGFHSGSAAQLLVHHGPETSIQSVSASAGELRPNADQFYTIAQDITFDGGHSAQLSQPVTAIQSVIWLGADLGGLSLQPDGRTVIAENSALSIARITCSVQAKSWQLTSPSTLAGLKRFPITVKVTAESGDIAQDGEIICQRGEGTFPGESISNPLLTTLEAKLSRGRAEIDAGESLQEIVLTCLYRSNILPGELVEIHDALLGKSFRAQVIGVSHSALGVKRITTIDLLRHVPST